MKLAKFLLTPPIAAISVFLSVTLGAQAAVYVKADATGANNGTSWTNAYTSLQTAWENHLDSGEAFFVAQGVHIINASFKPTGDVTVYGGFKGDETGTEEEMLAARDWDEYETIITTDLKGDDVWEHVEPTAGAYALPTVTTTTIKIVQDGRVFIPDPEGDHDMYCMKLDYGNYRGGTLLTMSTRGSLHLDGVWYTGGMNALASLPRLSTAASTIENCRFVGNRCGAPVVELGDSAVCHVYRNCKFIHGIAGASSVALQTYGPSLVEGCLFYGNCVPTSSPGCASTYGTIINIPNNTNKDRVRLVDCTVSRNYASSYIGTSTKEVSIIGGQYGVFDMAGCVVDGNMVSGSATLQATIVHFNGSHVNGCQFMNNLCEVCAVAGRTYELFRGAPDSAYNGILLDGCAFVSNRVSAVISETSPAGVCALGIFGNQTEKSQRSVLLNTTFYDNIVDAEESETVTAIRGRGVLFDATVTSAQPEMTVVNCTFTDSETDGAKDIVKFGTLGAGVFNILNSIFMTSADAADPFQFDTVAKVVIHDCNVKNMPEPPAGATVSGWLSDEIPLAPATAGSVLTFVPQVRTPGIRATCDFATNVIAIADTANFFQRCTLFRYRLNAGSAWSDRIFTPFNKETVEDAWPVSDAHGVARPFGAYTRGAVQNLPAEAETGHAVYIRREPISAGSLGSDELEVPYAQNVADGGTMKAVTALPVRGGSFAGWRYADEEEAFSTDLTLELSDVTADKTVVAMFSPPDIEMTFDLGDAGTFVDSGTSKTTAFVPAGTKPVPVPEYVPNTDYVIYAWTPSLADPSPAEAATYVAQSVSSAVRIIHVVPPGDPAMATSDGSGESWENPVDSIPAAYANAGRYRGEVWIKEGVYRYEAMMRALPNVTVRGGFAGNETEASQADPQAHPVFLNADIDENDYWKVDWKDPGAANRVRIWQDGVFNPPNPDGADICWEPALGASSDLDTDYFVLVDEQTPTVTGVRFEGLSFVCFRKGIAHFRVQDDVVFANCRFLGCGTQEDSTYTVIESEGPVTLEDCAFVGCFHPAYFQPMRSSPVITNIVRRCTFEGCTGYRRGGSAIQSGGAAIASVFVIEDCVFHRNAHNTAYDNSSVAITTYQFVDTTISGCLFEDNRVYGPVSSLIQVVNSGKGCVVSNCRFLNNRGFGTTDGSKSACFYFAGGDNNLVRDSLFLGNSLETTSSSSKPQAFSPVSMQRSGCRAQFLNCTFLSNRTDVVGAAAGSACGTFAALIEVNNGDWKYGLAFAHCVTKDSSISAGADTVAGEIALAETPAGLMNQNTSFGCVNSVFCPPLTGQSVLNAPAGLIPNVASCVLPGFDPTAYTLQSYDFMGKAFDEDPMLYPGLVFGENGIGQLRLSGRSDFCRGGIGVYLVDKMLYTYQPQINKNHPFRPLVSKYGNPVQPAGLTVDSEIVPDAFGAARRLKKIAFGAVNPLPQGLMIQVR